MNTRIITIDGPAGAGKTTISKLLSKKLGCVYVDTGALYRGVAYEIKRQGVIWENDEVLEVFLKNLDLNFLMEKDSLILISSGRDITNFIRTPDISMLASSSSAKPQVRVALLDIQRNIANTKDAVFEGRDMGTVVFPDAAYKFFLFADLSIRAKRRYNEISEESKDIKQVQEEMKIRDGNDSKRKAAPLKPAEDAIKIDSSLLTIEQVVGKMLKCIDKP
ncbi:MAG: (d)CMP kinase [Desulfobacula sp.]|jgi:cytidylate kinase|uniref:(d)CMP kinase n=1 Tax=Desulfobacula sp. TaxID=2593537 RepID=UPI001D38EE53|nr:(d)CMP kinase [Desulfobacula sp.]MBT3484701.1 (d)CMP kinase [Desulfobacula sp.]MBT3805821.1 (d)CMP kinase [Desulfobacula sp.]MBT4026215.1 (d)CMP kinase [Desulfobacula sp.]MBT4200024.1 (d)CMP kinase [Desulfobacula sp.]